MSATSPPSKACTKCGVVKPLDDFYLNKGPRDGRASWCRVCVAANNKERKYSSPNRQRKWRYGLTPEQFDSMVSGQAGRCLICEKELQPGRESQIDHCHTTGFVRGILCGGCNRGIGHLRDDPAIVLAAYRYLAVSIAEAAA